MSFFDTLCNPDTCSGGSEETELGPEEQGHQYFESGNYVAAASIWIDMVEHYTTPKMGRFPPPAASALSARTWLRLGLSLEAADSEELILCPNATEKADRWLTDGDTGEPTAPGRRSGGAVSIKRCRPSWRSA